MKIEIYGQPNCQWCEAAKALCERLGVEYTYINIRTITPEGFAHMRGYYGVPETWRTVPMIMVEEHFIGGYQEFERWMNE